MLCQRPATLLLNQSSICRLLSVLDGKEMTFWFRWQICLLGVSCAIQLLILQLFTADKQKRVMRVMRSLLVSVETPSAKWRIWHVLPGMALPCLEHQDAGWEMKLIKRCGQPLFLGNEWSLCCCSHLRCFFSRSVRVRSTALAAAANAVAPTSYSLPHFGFLYKICISFNFPAWWLWFKKLTMNIKWCFTQFHMILYLILLLLGPIPVFVLYCWRYEYSWSSLSLSLTLPPPHWCGVLD